MMMLKVRTPHARRRRFQTPLLNVTSRQCRFIVSEYPGCDLLRIPDIGNIELVSMA